MPPNNNVIQFPFNDDSDKLNISDTEEREFSKWMTSEHTLSDALVDVLINDLYEDYTGNNENKYETDDS